MAQGRIGLFTYRLKCEVQFIHFQQSPGVFRSTGLVRFVSLERKTISGGWNSLNPGPLHAWGSFSGPRSPVNSLGGSGYHYPNPFSNELMSSTWQSLVHFDDVSGPGFAMSHGSYSVNAKTPSGLGSITATVFW